MKGTQSQSRLAQLMKDRQTGRGCRWGERGEGRERGRRGKRKEGRGGENQSTDNAVIKRWRKQWSAPDRGNTLEREREREKLKCGVDPSRSATHFACWMRTCTTGCACPVEPAGTTRGRHVEPPSTPKDNTAQQKTHMSLSHPSRKPGATDSTVAPAR